MAVVTKYSPSRLDASLGRRAKTMNANSGVRSASGTIAVANGDNIASVFYLAQVPSSAILRHGMLDHTAITGASFSIGVRDPSTAIPAQDTVLGAAQSFATAAVKYVNQSAAANRGKRLWELLNLQQDPGRLLDIVLVQTADASAAGTIYYNIEWIEGR